LTFWLNLFAKQAPDARLELAVLGRVDERVDAAVCHQQNHAEVVERGRVVDISTEHSDQVVDLQRCPADDEAAADRQ